MIKQKLFDSITSVEFENNDTITVYTGNRDSGNWIKASNKANISIAIDSVIRKLISFYYEENNIERKNAPIDDFNLIAPIFKDKYCYGK